MYKCLICDAEFEKITGDNCPECKDTRFENAKQCRYCEHWFHSDDDYRDGSCGKCAKEQLTVDSGIEYIEAYGLQREFYVVFLTDSTCSQASSELIDLCRRGWREYASNHVNDPLGKLRDFVFADMGAWMEWLEERRNNEEVLT